MRKILKTIFMWKIGLSWDFFLYIIYDMAFLKVGGGGGGIKVSSLQDLKIRP